jgi:hypothetical protein
MEGADDHRLDLEAVVFADTVGVRLRLLVLAARGVHGRRKQSRRRRGLSRRKPRGHICWVERE